jgi:hypothetical protein
MVHSPVLMEKIMSKTQDTSRLRIEDIEALDLGGATFTARELRDDELQKVSGGGGRNGTRVRFDRLDPAPFSIDIGTSENLVVNASSRSF